MKFLAIDIGNTSIDFGLFSAEDGNNILKKTKILTAKFREIPFNDYGHAIITSVVPSSTKKVIRRLKVRPVIIDYKNIPVKIKLEEPEKIGSDRLVNAVAAAELYGTPSVVIDFGTATTFDIVSENGEYLGGVIAPGIRISAEALYEKTAKLPSIKPEAPKNVIGKNTKEAILSGIFFGHVGMIKEVMAKIKSENPPLTEKVKNLTVILTGGYADIFSPYFPDFIIDKDITLKGLKIIFEKLQNKS